MLTVLPLITDGCTTCRILYLTPCDCDRNWGVFLNSWCVKGSISFDNYWPSCTVGRGGKKGSVECCPVCRGSGMQVRIHQIGPGMVQQIQSVCQECHGQGERISPKDRCKICSGRKIVVEKKILEVHIDKGMILVTIKQKNMEGKRINWFIFCFSAYLLKKLAPCRFPANVLTLGLLYTGPQY